MKELWIIRHAKSSWAKPELADHDRPLNDRGKKDAYFMADFMVTQYELPEMSLVSSAKRARKTAKIFRKEWGMGKDLFKKNKDLYLASDTEILYEIGKIDEFVNRLAVFGHNPGITNLVNRLGTEYQNNVPTCAVVVIRSDAEYWSNFEAGNCELVGIYIPKAFDI